MKKAVIDIGSNTINLLIGEVTSNGSLQVFHDEKNHAKLAKGGINNKTITPEAFRRGLNAIEHYVNLCRMHHIAEENIKTFATATIRSTDNGRDFTNTLKHKFGIETHVIDGETEATLIFQGVKNGIPDLKNNFLVMDIGGGSVEFIIANQKGILWKKSFDLGVSRLLDRFKPNDPISDNDVTTISAYIKSQLTELDTALETWHPQILVGSSGSFDTLRSILQAKHETLKGKTSYYKIEQDELAPMFVEFMQCSTQQRLTIEGMDPMRAEYMPIAAILIRIILEKSHIAEIFQCSYALKEGAFFN